MIKITDLKLIELGAIKIATWSESNKPFSTHYFNSNGLEVAYYINNMLGLTGLQILDKPRHWSIVAKIELNILNLSDLYLVNTVNYSGSIECFLRSKYGYAKTFNKGALRERLESNPDLKIINY